MKISLRRMEHISTFLYHSSPRLLEFPTHLPETRTRFQHGITRRCQGHLGLY
ncbi:Protein of unknown function [Pyronema omphalodes CBS 100304]|uniref:Uncharacterized protein n=1 Tax=Pyronema omphalodes (strain CBS 100304) TaxID=1076935 RepID=U4LJ10_PYROM|nr:Protein of unknown function [Pyronema omphalodes CBS 100304]